MNNRRRRADDFTDSLTSFRQTMHKDKQNSSLFQRDLDDNSNINATESEQHDSHLSKNKSRAESIIIAGSLNNQHYISSDLCKIVEDNSKITYNNSEILLKDRLNLSDETSYLSLKPDLNKCINLFHNEHLSKENHTFEDHLNFDSFLSEIKINKDIDSHLNKNKIMDVPCNLIKGHPCIASYHSLEKAVMSIKDKNKTNNKLQRSKSCSMLNNNLKRNTNHTIKASYSSVPSINTATRYSCHDKINVAALFDRLSLSKPFCTLPNKEDADSTKENQKCDSESSETISREQLSFDLKTYLQSLEYQKPLEETTVQKDVLRRWSANFSNSPTTFIEKLLTIIEESVVDDDICAQLEHPEISSCRLTNELRKMCKLIEDETMPEWPQSPMSKTFYTRQRSLGSGSPLRKSLNAFVSQDKDLYLTSPRRNIKSPKKFYSSKNILYNTKSPLHDSTNTFECLEAFCEKFYADKHKAVSISKQENNPLQSPLQSIDSILNICETQMASLETSPNIHEQLKNAAITSASQYNDKISQTQNLRYRLLTHEKHNKPCLKKVSDTFKQSTKDKKSYEMIESNDLENTLMYEIAKKRQRCLDTAKVMMEIDTNLELVDSQQICSNIDKKPTNYTEFSDTKFMETLISVKKYQEYLEKHKPMLNLLRTESRNSHIPSKTSTRAKEKSRKNLCSRRLENKTVMATLKVPSTEKFSRMKPKSRSPSPKNSTNKIISKPKLFVTPGKIPINKNSKPKRTYFPDLVVGMNKEKKFTISPHPKNIYRQIDNYDYVVSPVGMYIKGANPHLMKNLRSKTDEKLLTPTKKQITPSPSPQPTLKFQLSPKPQKTTITKTVGNENVADNFLHSKVHDKLSSHVNAINKAKTNKVGNCINE